MSDIPNHRHGTYVTHPVTKKHPTMNARQQEIHKALAREDVSKAIYNILRR